MSSDAIYFDSQKALAAASDLNFRPRKSRPPLPIPEELEAQRRKAVRDGCQYVNGKTGVTVFNFGGAL